MKRSLQALFVAVLMIVSSVADVDAAKKPSKKSKAKAAAVDMEQPLTAKRPKPAPNVAKTRKQADGSGDTTVVPKPGLIPFGAPQEMELKRGASRRLDLRRLPQTPPVEKERPERDDPPHTPVTIESTGVVPEPSLPGIPPTANPPAPPPNIVFEGLDREFWGAGSPPDTTGDVGPVYYIQAVNTSVGIYRKSDGVQEAAFTFDTLMSQGSFGNQCDNENFGDPVVLYDTFEDRWILTDFAFTLDGGGNVNPPVAFQCFAVSMNGDPLTGGWNFYSIQLNDALNDYPKLGVWTDGIYMSANMFGFPAGSPFQRVLVWAFNKMQMYAGAPNVQVVTFNLGAGDFTVVPSNARLQTGTPPPGRPNLFISTWNFTNALTVYKFQVDWTNVTLSTFTGPDTPIAATSWPSAAVANVPQSGTLQLLDALQIRAMVQNQYTNFAGTESLWIPHTVRRAAGGFAAPRWYQVDVTGGTVAPTIPQATTWDPDAANVMHRWMPSLALDRAGNMALGYSTSSSTTFPSIKYAGRLAGDPINTFSQTEQTMFLGTASQTSSARWGDYSSMMLDPDGCTFWYTNEYANPALPQLFSNRWKTKVGSFSFPGCVPVGAGGTVTGTVTETPGGTPIPGATIQFGARTTTTNGSGVYTFLNIPAGTYPSITASKPGYVSQTVTNIVVTDGGTTTQDFQLALAATSACLTDTTQSDFLDGVPTNVDVNFTPGDVLLRVNVDQQNTAGTTTGTGFGTPAWTGQTFIAGVTASIIKAEFTLFCSGCGPTPPNLTLSVRNTAAGLPTGADLTTATIPGSAFASGATTTVTATFVTPVAVTSGTQYALVLRPVAVPAGTGYFWIRSSPSTYANGSRVLSADSGGTWSADTTRDYNFKVYAGFPPSGNLVSSPKDSNPLSGLTPIWSTLTWTATTPANTSVQFQVAGSNSPFGPFNFIGPDGTSGTFFTTSPAPLTQLYGLRYMEYKAYLATTDASATPALHDVTVCDDDIDCSGVVATITPTPAAVCENSTGNTASGPAGMTTYQWGIVNGTITSPTNGQSITYTAGASGNVTLTLDVVSPTGCMDTESIDVTINPTPATPTITPGGPTTFCQGDSVTLTSSSATGNQWYLNGNPIGGETNQTYVAMAGGNYTVVVTLLGCSSATSAITTVTVNPLPPTPTITPGGPTTFCQGGSVLLTSSSATGNQWYLDGNPIGGETNQTYLATASGSYTVTVTDGNSCSSTSAPTVVTVNPTPPTPTITPGGPTTFCAGGSVTLTSSSASGNQWYLDGNPIGGATNQNYVATASASYTVIVTAAGCPGAPSAATVVTVNPIPATPTITPGGPTTFCQGGSVTLTSSSASGNQWYLNGNPIGGETNQNYVATAGGSYTVVVTALGCSSAPSAATVVTVNPTPPTPTITPSGPTTFCAGGSVTLTSSAASGNQWFLNGSPIGGATNQTYVASVAGDYTVIVTASGCPSAPSAVTTVTVNPLPNATITTPGTIVTGAAGSASVADAGVGATYLWSIINGTINGSSALATVNFTAGVPGTLTLNVTVTTAAGCSSPGTTNVTVTAAPPAVTVTQVNPNNGTYQGGTSVTITGTGFLSGASVTFGGTAATSVVVVNSTTITAVTPAHAAGAVNVTVTNTDTTTGTLTNGYTYNPQRFDANGDGVIDPSDIFYLVNYLFLSGPVPSGAAGLMSGDANGDNVVDPADIFYVINYLFLGGPVPLSVEEPSVAGARLSGALTFGRPFVRDGRTFIPLTVTAPDSVKPQALSLKVRLASGGTVVGVRRTGELKKLEPTFEITRRTSDGAAYLVAFDRRSGGLAGGTFEVEISPRGGAPVRIDIDPALTLLADGAGLRKATVAGGTLEVRGAAVASHERAPATIEKQQQLRRME